MNTLNLYATRLISLVLLAGPATHGQDLFPAHANAVAIGSHGAFLSRARVGDSVEVQVRIQNVVDPLSPPRIVNSVSLLIHHGSGDVVMTNLLSGPVQLSVWGDPWFVVSTNFIVQPGDPDILMIDFTVEIMYAGWWWENLRPINLQDGCHIIVTRDGPPTLLIVPTGPGTVEISYSMAHDGWTLESSEDLGRNWTAVTKVPATRNGFYTITQETAAGERKFYRLVKP